MDLWIRSQDKTKLIKSNGVALTPSGLSIYPIGATGVLGTYKTEERALEILNEIQHHMINKYYLIPKEKLTQEEKCQLMNIGKFNPKIDVVSTLEKMELKPLNNNVYIYEMPKE